MPVVCRSPVPDRQQVKQQVAAGPIDGNPDLMDVVF
jgi:hypothetical protein